MLTRNDQPEGFGLTFATENNFSFAVDSVFTNVRNENSNVSPLPNNRFLLSDGSSFLLSDGTFFLLSEP